LDIPILVDSSSKYAVAMGGTTVAKGTAAIAMGSNVSTNGTTGEIALGANSTVGAAKKRRLNVGNGTSDTNLADAFTILVDGRTGVGFDNFEALPSTTKLQVNGGIKVGNESSCNAANEGTIHFDSTNNGDYAHAIKANKSKEWDCIHTNKRVFAGFPHIYLRGYEFLIENRT